MSECLFVSSLLGQSTGIYLGAQVCCAQRSCFTAAAMAASPLAVGVAEILSRQNPFVDRRANCRSRASHKSSSVSSSHGCAHLITTPAMEASLEAGAFGEISHWRSNSTIDGYSPIAVSQGWSPISTIHGQCCQDGGLARRERNATMFVGGVRRRGARQDSFLNRTRSNYIIRASAEEKKKAGGISFGDQLLDYIEGGPKLRKWYGAPDQLPKDSGNKEQKPEVPESVEADDADNQQDLVRDVVLVTDAESATGQLVVLELILRRLRVRALVKDIKAATVGFGAYVEAVEGDVNDTVTLKKVMRGVRAIVCPTKVGKLANRELVKGVEHIVLLSKLAVSKNQGGLGALFGGLSKRDAEANEAAIASLGIPYTIVRAGSLKDEEGGKLGFRYGQDGNVQGSISREDAAYVCVEALDSPPQSARVFEVANGREEVEDWSVVLTSMQETTTASGS